ncbi:helix-turn-helix transcriptional regulator [Trinickia sp.]|uniref:helix-turn-helix transcriptional regulator n=1 Tax=Trinickia sp. TaxID=2571163 RepID=UPI003F7DDCC8
MTTRTISRSSERPLVQERQTRAAARSRGGANKKSDALRVCVREAAAEAARLGPARAGSRLASAWGADMNVAAQLMSIEDPGERTRMLSALMHVMGFHSLAYATVGARGKGCVHAQAWALDDTTPHHFGGSYFEAGYWAHDPRLGAVRTSNVPLVWDMEWLLRAWRRDGAPEAMRGLFPALEREGIGSGVMFGIPTVRGNVRALVSLAASRSNADWIVENVLVQALTFGLSLHRFASDPRHAIAAEGEAARETEAQATLSDMQVRILACVVGGLSDKQIAARLQTTPHNVDYHLRLLRRRYGAANRTHLAFLVGGLALE